MKPPLRRNLREELDRLGIEMALFKSIKDLLRELQRTRRRQRELHDDDDEEDF